MVEVKIDRDTRLRAAEEARKMGVLNGSLRGGRGNIYGMLGETLAHAYLGGERVGAQRSTCDIVLPDGRTIDVKTGSGKSKPLPHYAARVYGSEAQRENIGSKCDGYFFVRCHENKHLLWLLGWLPADEFVQKATFHPQGSVNPVDGRLCRSDEYVVPVSELRHPRTLLSR